MNGRIDDTAAGTAAERDLSLPDLLDLTAAEPLCRMLRDRLGDGDLTMDGARVARISTPCLQVLVAAAATARARGIGFRLRHASPVLTEAVADLGLTAVLPIEA